MNWKEFKGLHAECKACELCETRSNICLFRGSTSCDLLIVGESPNVAEDVMGKPFQGEASIMFEKMLKSKGLHSPVKIGWTYLISCIPKDAKGVRSKKPKAIHINACRTRLQDLVDMCKPKVVLLLGSVTSKYWEKQFEHEYQTFKIMHPAAVHGMGASVQQMVAIERTLATLEEVADVLIPE